MTISERRSILLHSLTPETPICVNCVHYYEHYRKDGYRFNMGHCCYPRMKPRRDYDTCEHFEKKEVASCSRANRSTTPTT